MSDNPWALVTGASRGLGAKIALDLAQRGYSVVICARTKSKLREFADIHLAKGLTLIPVVADITNPDQVESMFDRIRSYTDHLDVCVNNAGSNYSHQLARWSERSRSMVLHPIETWEQTINLCLTGTFLVGRLSAEMMVQQSRGVIVNISSSVRNGAFGQSAYAAAKAGVASLTRSWAYELGRFGVRVVCIAPGVIDGEKLKERMSENPKHKNYMERLRKALPLGRWCSEDEICRAVGFAILNESVTGTVLEVDGGGIPPRV